MSGRRNWSICLSASLSLGVLATGCSEEEIPTNGTSSGNVSSGGSSTTASTASDTSDTSGNVTVGDGDGDVTGNITVGDGDGDAGTATGIGDGDGDGDATGNITVGDGDGDTGAENHQECIAFAIAGSTCGLSQDILGTQVAACESELDAAEAVGGACLTATIDYWNCRANLPCDTFSLGGPEDCYNDNGVAAACA